MKTVEEVISKAKDLADAAGKKTGELVSLTKLKIEAAETQKEISAQLEAIGRLVYDAHKNAVSADEEIAPRLEAVATLEEKAAEISDKIDELRRTKRCAACGKNNAADAVYCQSCGKEL